jgi:phosphoribosylanthranilate isomerase
MTISAKTCGLSTLDTLNAALDAKAEYVGFVFYPPSPRNVDFEQAKKLSDAVGSRAKKVGVFVNPDDEFLTKAIKAAKLDYVQLHGNEPVERVQYVQKRFNIKVIKAISIASVSDISRAREYERYADILLFDAKPPVDLENALPGGNGLEFDWKLISGKKWNIPWMLSGGLDATNVKEAIKISGAKIIDVSSGLEEEPGRKNNEKIKTFMDAVQDID